MKHIHTFGFVAGFALAVLPVTLNAGPFQTVPYEPQPRPELYVFGYGGITWMGDFEGRAMDGNPQVALNIENGWGAGGGLGLRTDWLGGTRFEVEGLYRSSLVEDVLVNGVSFRSDGDVQVAGVAVNFIKELVWGGLFPYVGIGVGWGNVDVNAPFAAGSIDDGASSFLWQVIAGLDFPWTKRSSLFLEYRYMPVTDFDLGINTIAGTENVSFDDLSNHSVFAGIRYAF